jgi:hypothetical protein
MDLRRLLMTYRSRTDPSFIAILILLFALTLSGCAGPRVVMYQGPELDASKHATIRAIQQIPQDGTLSIVSVDGKPTDGFFSMMASEVAVLPGKHDLVVSMAYPFSYARAKLWLVAEAGERYVVKSRSPSWNTVAMWIENERTGQPTGGVSGSEDEPKKNAH